MEIIVPTNWDDTLVDKLQELKIKEVYGKLPIDVVGGGRPTSGLSYVSKKKARIHIQKCINSGINFNYLLNASTMGNIEFSNAGRKKIYRLIDWIYGCGVRKVTVAIPYLLQLIKDRYNDIELSISTMSGVDTLKKVLYWQKLGATEITLAHPFTHRNFKLLKNIVSNSTCDIRLIANAACLSDCPFFNFHNAWDSYASQTKFIFKPGLFICYYLLYCRYMRILNPVEFLKAEWIRPEDLALYEKIGISRMKLIDRRCDTETIIRITKAYIARQYNGNLIDLIPSFHSGTKVNKNNFFIKLAYLLHPFDTKFRSLLKFKKAMQNIDIMIDNQKLDGFLEKKQNYDCTSLDCEKCRYCDEVASEVIKYDKASFALLKGVYEDILKDFHSGKI